jgi:hypothetical protein
MRKAPPAGPAPLAPSLASSASSEDPFAEQPLRPVLRTEEKILAELRKQLQLGLISMREYSKAARNAVAVLTAEEAVSLATPGHTLRMVFTNERRQFESGLITESEFARLKRAAVALRTSSGAIPQLTGQESPRSGTGSPRKNSIVGSESPRANLVSPRKQSFTSPLRRLARSDSKESPTGSPLVTEKKHLPSPGASPVVGEKKPLPSPHASPPATDKKTSPPLRRAPAGPAPLAPGKVKSEPSVPDDYVPFAPNKLVAQHAAATKAGIGDAIALDLQCSIIGVTKTERRKYLGSTKVYAAFRVQVRGKGGLEFFVVRRYGEFLKMLEVLLEFWPDLPWPPALPRKAAFVDTDAAMVERVSSLLSAYLEVVCRYPAVVRSRDFVLFIDPKTNPQLGSILPGLIVRQGWIRLRKAQTLAPLRRLWAVLSGRNMLYLYPSNKELAAEPFVTIVLELCTVDFVYSQQMACDVIELHRFCIGKRYFLRPDDSVGEWLCDLRTSHSKRIHTRILPLLPEEVAVKRMDERREVIRKATQINSTPKPVVPSMSKAYYEKDRIDHNIIFRNSAIKAATRYKLVEYLLNHQICPPPVVASFLLTFHSFMTSAELMDQLFSYFRKSPFPVRKSTGTVDQLQPEQLRIIAILQKWLSMCPSDFSEDAVLRESLESFAAANNISNLVFRRKVRHVLPQTKPAAANGVAGRSTPMKPRTRSNSTGDLKDSDKIPASSGGASSVPPTAATQRSKVVVDASGTVRLTKVAPGGARRRAIPDFARGTSAKPLPTPKATVVRRRNSSENVKRGGGVGGAVLPFGFFDGVPWDLFCLDVEELSRQLSLQHQRLFCAINPMELLNQSWNKETKNLKAPNVCLLIESFNVLSGIVSTSVVRVEEPRERAGAIAFWIRVAQAAFQHNDYSCTMAIVSGLLNSSVHRLARTWAIVKKRWETLHGVFDKLVSSLSSDRNYSLLRAALRACNPPTMPYLGIFLQDMTFADDGNKDVVMSADGVTKLVNFEKRVQLASKIQDIVLYQSVPYQFERVEPVQLYLSRFAPLGSEKLYARSLLLEPRQ